MLGFNLVQSKLLNFGVLATPARRGDLKESPSLGESSHMTLSRMARYSSLTPFLEQKPKANEDKVHMSSFIYVQGGERYKICSVPRIFKTSCKLFVCAKGKHKIKRTISPG